MNENFFKGFGLGLIIPIIGLYIYLTYVLKIEFIHGIKQLWHEKLFSQVMSLSILTNLLPLFVFNMRKENKKMRGVISASILYALITTFIYLFF